MTRVVKRKITIEYGEGDLVTIYSTPPLNDEDMRSVLGFAVANIYTAGVSRESIKETVDFICDKWVRSEKA